MSIVDLLIASIRNEMKGPDRPGKLNYFIIIELGGIFTHAMAGGGEGAGGGHFN